MRACLLIPHYEHMEALPKLLAELEAQGLPCIVVDDGSSAPTREALRACVRDRSWVQLEERPWNGGKGMAVEAGLRRAAEQGFSHAILLDADGQHTPADVPRFLEASRAHPEAMVLGVPVFDHTVPRARHIGHGISCFWARVETLSGDIRDPLCGYRCLPIAPTLSLLDRRRLGRRMDFDPELIVRLYWEGVPVVSVETRVRYLDGGVSHFHTLADNARISWAHTKLVFGMLARAPFWAIRALRTGRRRPLRGESP